MANPVTQQFIGFWQQAGAMSFGSAVNPIMRDIQYATNNVRPNLIPSLDALVTSWNTLGVRREQLRVAMRLLGAKVTGNMDRFPWESKFEKFVFSFTSPPIPPKNIWTGLLQAGHWVPTVDTTLTMLNRGYISTNVAYYLLERAGIYDVHLRDVVHELRHYLPPPQDIIHFAVRETFANPVLPNRGGEQYWDRADSELPKDYVFWANRQGLGKVTVNDATRPAGVRTEDFALHEWRAHYILPSATMGYNFLHRLRPGRVPQGLQFTSADLELLLKNLDYMPQYRKQLEAISYAVPRLVDIKNGLLFDVIQKPEAIELMQDRGQTEQNATWQVDLFIRQNAASRFKAMQRLSREQIRKAFKLGAIDERQALEILTKHGLNADEATASLQMIRVEMESEFIAEATRLIRRKYFAGILSQVQAGNELARLGITPEARGNFLRIWGYEMSGPRKTLTSSKIADLVSRGLLSIEEASLRLSNLGYDAASSRLLLLAAIQDFQSAAARAAMQVARTRQQQQRQIAQQIKEQEKLLEKLRRELAKQSGPERMLKWLKKGLISPQLVAGRLAQLGWEPDNIQREIATALGNGQASTT